jgi:hypothetical protein
MALARPANRFTIGALLERGVRNDRRRRGCHSGFHRSWLRLFVCAVRLSAATGVEKTNGRESCSTQLIQAMIFDAGVHDRDELICQSATVYWIGPNVRSSAKTLGESFT